MRRMHWTVLGALAAAVLVGACSSQEAKVRQLGSVTFADHGTQSVRGKTALALEADSNYFKPTFLRGETGQQLTLTIENESASLHNFSVAGQQIDVDIPAKGKVQVTVTFPAMGAARFFCKYHADQGMNGELLVGDTAPQPIS
jgi:plastocyanin